MARLNEKNERSSEARDSLREDIGRGSGERQVMNIGVGRLS